MLLKNRVAAIKNYSLVATRTELSLFLYHSGSQIYFYVKMQFVKRSVPAAALEHCTRYKARKPSNYAHISMVFQAGVKNTEHDPL